MVAKGESNIEKYNNELDKAIRDCLQNLLQFEEQQYDMVRAIKAILTEEDISNDKSGEINLSFDETTQVFTFSRIITGQKFEINIKLTEVFIKIEEILQQEIQQTKYTVEAKESQEVQIQYKEFIENMGRLESVFNVMPGEFDYDKYTIDNEYQSHYQGNDGYSYYFKQISIKDKRGDTKFPALTFHIGGPVSSSGNDEGKIQFLYVDYFDQAKAEKKETEEKYYYYALIINRGGELFMPKQEYLRGNIAEILDDPNKWEPIDIITLKSLNELLTKWNGLLSKAVVAVDKKNRNINLTGKKITSAQSDM